MSSSYGRSIFLLFFFVALLLSKASELPSHHNVRGLKKAVGEEGLVPVVGGRRGTVFNESVHTMMGVGFRQCAICECYNPVNRTMYFPCDCCFVLECGLKKQFGLCSFTPKACNCNDCVL